MPNKFITAIPALITLFGVSISGCTKSAPRAGTAAPNLTGSEVHCQGSGSQQATLSNGATINVQCVGSKAFAVAEGALSTDSFDAIQSATIAQPEAARNQALSQAIEKAFAESAKAGALPMKAIPSVGYFQMLIPYNSAGLFTAFKGLDLGSILVQPVYQNKAALDRAKAVSKLMAEDGAAPPNPRGDNANFSGLARVGAIEFAAQAEKDINDGVPEHLQDANATKYKVDGSSVIAGITDTGITYNHPTFYSKATGKNRIVHMTDSDLEGAIYINPAATLTAKDPADGNAADLVVDAQVLVTPTLPDMPAGDDLQTLKGLKIKASPELKALLLAPNASNAKLGFIDESVVGSTTGEEPSPVDMNHNGKIDDKLSLIYFPAQNGQPERVYFDASGTGDFTNSPALKDFNASGDTMPVFAERIGFSMDDLKLPNKAGTDTVAVRTVSFVGYDAGNHGTHVAGILAGAKTLSNDPDNTLARGIAPEAQIAQTRVCTNNAGCSDLAGIAELAANGKVDLINMSLGGLDAQDDGIGVAETLINRITMQKNIMFLLAAGNDGPGHQTVGSPGTARLALTIGASATKNIIQGQYQWPGLGAGSNVPSNIGDDNADFMLFFSSRGPTANGGFKPDLVAPGTELSSVQLNGAPGTRGGIDDFWGTSMATPTAAGTYALFLDAIRKYNLAHADKPLPSDTLTLRRVLLESARPFDVNRLDTSTGAYTTGQYTWADEGTGMIYLPNAWKLLFQVRDSTPPAAVTLNGKPVELDYLIHNSAKEPNGLAYDGSVIENKAPAFGAGLYLSTSNTDTMRRVYIERQLPASLAASASAGDLTRQLETTEDVFWLKTVIYGSDITWLKAGVMEMPNCADSPTSDLRVLGVGAVPTLGPDGTGSIAMIEASNLAICIDHEKAAKLPPGDHGALIYGYRKVGNQVSPIASFIIPIYMNVPEKTMTASTSIDDSRTIQSFGIDRHYVMVPQGTSVLRISLSVPPIKTDANGVVAAGEVCSGVQLMAYEGANTAAAIKDETKARVQNCTTNGSPSNDPKDRTVTITQANPTPGIWDVHVFGQYRYTASKYEFKVDYVTGSASVDSISGGLGALAGTLSWTLKDASVPAQPDADQSSYALTGLEADTNSQVAQDGNVWVASPLGVLRSYPNEATSVTITIGQSPGNDIDLYVNECPADATTPDDPRCTLAGSSTGPTDSEKVTIIPKAEMKYAARVNGSTVKDDGKFVSTETLNLVSEDGTIKVSGTSPQFSIAYGFASALSAIAKNPLFTSGKYMAVGSMTLNTADGMPLVAIPVKVKNQ